MTVVIATKGKKNGGKKNMYENNQRTSDGLNVKFIRGVFYHSYGLKGFPRISSIRLLSDFSLY
jgi:hypothetical protein